MKSCCQNYIQLVSPEVVSLEMYEKPDILTTSVGVVSTRQACGVVKSEDRLRDLTHR